MDSNIGRELFLFLNQQIFLYGIVQTIDTEKIVISDDYGGEAVLYREPDNPDYITKVELTTNGTND